MSESIKKRNPAMDIIRCFALFFVVSVHFFLNNGYYTFPIDGTRMYIMTMIRSFSMICVPLFITLTGYLMSNKKVSRAYYKKIVYTLGIYVLASICCVVYETVYLKQPFVLKTFLSGFFNYTNANYSWYVEMYIGLFLLCPFLNVLYNNLRSQKEKQALLLTMMFLTALPSVINSFYPDINWFLNPTSSNYTVKILPTYWLTIYPITYYFIGCYLKEFKLKLKSRHIALLLSAVAVLNGLFNIYRSYKVNFIWGEWQDYNSLFTVILTVLFFAFFDNLNYDRFPKAAVTILRHISGVCFGAYLVSWIFDQHFYKILNTNVPTVFKRLDYYVIIVPAVFICSILLSFVLEYIYKLIAFCIGKAVNKKVY